MPRITCSELLERGDLASRTRDNMTLARIARLLAPRVGDPISDRLHHIAKACDGEDDFVPEWLEVRAQIIERLAIAGS